jgi:hypothetical protein
LWGLSDPKARLPENGNVMARYIPRNPRRQAMFDKLIRRLFLSREAREMEEHYNRQWQTAEAEVAAIQESMSTALMTALTPLDPQAQERYQFYRAKYGSRALAETAAVADIQQSALAQAFSLLDPGHMARLNQNRHTRGLPPL